MKKILVFNRFYLPGYKAGGPIRTLANMVDRLGGEFDFYIVTTDRDSGDTSAYSNIIQAEWSRVGKASVMYLIAREITIYRIRKLISDIKPDLVYLNSFYDPQFTLRVLLSRYFFGVPSCPVLLAPRGEFSKSAISIKSGRKKTFRFAVRLFGLYRGLFWQASSKYEKKDILVRMPYVDSRMIFEAFNVPRLNMSSLNQRNRKRNSILNICFLSRITPMKNLDYALQILSQVKKQINFTIYGPISDERYWEKCLIIIDSLPSNIQCRYKGAIQSKDVHTVLSRHDIFLLPTRGENYGHVIQEALSAGLLVLISDQTPWQNLETESVGWSLPLTELHRFVERIEDVSQWESEKLGEARERAIQYGLRVASRLDTIAANREMLLRAAD